MEKEKVSVEFHIPLTGSQFFDAVIYMQAHDLARRYNGVSVSTIDERLIISGQLPEREAAALRGELDIDG